MSYQNLLAHEVPEFLQRSDVAVLDMRDGHSFGMGHLQGAQPANDTAVGRLIRERRFDRPILIYCYHGNSSRDLAQFIAGMGFANVFNLDGGWQAWSNFCGRQDVVLSAELSEWLAGRGFDTANINSRIENGMSPLMVAALEGNNTVLCDLLEAGADVNLVNDDENNALWFACVKSAPETIAQLLEQGVDADNQNVNGATCLIYAASAGKFEAVKALVEAGADLYKATHDGFNALDSAATLPILRYLKDKYRSAISAQN